MYFKTIHFNCASSQIETALREATLKRHTALDFQTSPVDSEKHKYFLGFESESSITFTRIRKSFQKLLPKVIVEFPKNDFTYCRIRLSIISLILFALITIAFVLQIFYSLKYSELTGNTIEMIIYLLLFIILTRIEIKLTINKLHATIL